ncbi:MAG: hypothetical protein IKV59_07165 [Lachnospiraceae bacterium]|nr:hypothetical protein [Lachnospiraceae bacterium]
MSWLSRKKDKNKGKKNEDGASRDSVVVDPGKPEKKEPEKTPEQIRQENEARRNQLTSQVKALTSKVNDLKRADQEPYVEAFKDVSARLKASFDSTLGGGVYAKYSDERDDFDEAHKELENAIAEAGYRVKAAKVQEDLTALVVETASIVHLDQRDELISLEKRLQSAEAQMKGMPKNHQDEVKKLYDEVKDQIGRKRSSMMNDRLNIYLSQYSNLGNQARALGSKDDADKIKMLEESINALISASGKFYGSSAEAINTAIENLRNELQAAKNRQTAAHNQHYLSQYTNAGELLKKMGGKNEQSEVDAIEKQIQELHKNRGEVNKETSDAGKEAERLVGEARNNIENGKKENVIKEFKGLTNQVKQIVTADQEIFLMIHYKTYHLLAQKRGALKDGNSEELMQLQFGLNKEFDEAAKRVAADKEKLRKEGVCGEMATSIAGQKGTPVETLINKVKTLNGSANAAQDKIRPGAANGYVASTVKNEDIKEIPKSKTAVASEKIKEKFSLAAVGAWFKEKVDEWEDTIDSLAGIAGDITGLVGDSGDFKGIGDTVKELQDKKLGENGALADQEAEATGIIGNVLGLVNAILHVVSLVKQISKYGKSRMATDGVQLDAQGKWQAIRGILHTIVDLFGDAIDMFSVFIDLVPILGPCLAICKGGLSLALNVADAATDCVHVEMARRDRKAIWERIQEKKAKYSKEGDDKDTTAANAYTVKTSALRKQSTSVDEQRKKMLKTVAEANRDRTDAARVNIITSADLRSRNDSVYREAQYGMADRMDALRQEIKIKERSNDKEGAAATRSKLRQVEALEMMEEYNEIDKAHHKMSVALLHKFEDVGKDAIDITKASLSLAGELTAMTVVGAPAAAVLLGVAGGMAIGKGAYELTRKVGAKAYDFIQDITGAKDNKATTREDMAISLIEKMEEVGKSKVWEGTGFKTRDTLLDRTKVPEGVLLRQGKNVRHLHNVFRRGLDADMPALIGAGSKKDMKEKIAKSFGQDD